MIEHLQKEWAKGKGKVLQEITPIRWETNEKSLTETLITKNEA